LAFAVLFARLVDDDIAGINYDDGPLGLFLEIAAVSSSKMSKT